MRQNRRTATLLAASALVVLGTAGLGRGREPDLAEMRHLPLQRSAHFEVAHTLEATTAADLSQLLEVLYARYLEASRAAGFRPRVPAGPLPWLCLSDPLAFAPYAGPREGGMPADDQSYYSACTNTVALLCAAEGGAGQGTTGRSLVGFETWRISHEVAHQMSFNTGLQTRGVLYPVWVSEGLATQFETHDPREGGFAGANPARQRRLAAAFRQGRLRPLGEMVVLTDPPTDHEARLDVYAQSWGLVQFLSQREPRAFRRYLYTLAMRPSGRRPLAALQAEFAAAFGPDEQLQAAWEVFLATGCGTPAVTAQKDRDGSSG